MTKLLDTNICIAYLDGRDPKVQKKLLSQSLDDVALCSVVKAELLYGARHSARVEENLARLAAFFGPLRSLPFDDDAAERYGEIRAQLRRSGTPIGGNDMMIAAIAASAGATVVTRNQEEFRRIPGLRVESW